VQIYESLAAALIFIVLLQLAPRKKFDGQVALTYVILYAIARFTVEFFRGDAIRGFVFGSRLSTSQFISALLFAGAVALYPYLMKRQRAAAATPAA
jgi:phosphatidylglycerol---prolipoprotein diacylglyceryl transferase